MHNFQPSVALNLTVGDPEAGLVLATAGSWSHMSSTDNLPLAGQRFALKNLLALVETKTRAKSSDHKMTSKYIHTYIQL